MRWHDQQRWAYSTCQLEWAQVKFVIGSGGAAVDAVKHLTRCSVIVNKEGARPEAMIWGPSDDAIDWARRIVKGLADRCIRTYDLAGMDRNDNAAWDSLDRRLALGVVQPALAQTQQRVTRGQCNPRRRRIRHSCPQWRVRGRVVTALRGRMKRLLQANRLMRRELTGVTPGEWQHLLQVGSPVTKVQYMSTTDASVRMDHGDRRWESWCPCCKKPLDVWSFYRRNMDLGDDAEAAAIGSVTLPNMQPRNNPVQQRYAYCAALWGNDAGYVLGALVLGKALRRTSQEGHDLVLMVTNAVPAASCELLAKVWRLKRVDYVDAVEALFRSKGYRFDGCFTKLHALGLLDYAKVLMLDLDLAILGNPHELFELPAPAALKRGQNCMPHGSRIDGRRFFRDEAGEDAALNWCQGGGINAGVMLLEPNKMFYERSLQEVSQPHHPEHVPGAGPEQDYLSRLYAPWWRHISVEYNYQLHHVFYGIDAILEWESKKSKRRAELEQEEPLDGQTEDGQDWRPTRLAVSVDDIKVLHFSGELKMWDRQAFFAEVSDKEFTQLLLRNCNHHGYRRWISRTGSASEYEPFGVKLEETDGDRELFFAGKPLDESMPIVQHSLDCLREALTKAMVCWHKDLQTLPELFKMDSLETLLHTLGQAANTENSSFHPMQRVNVMWYKDGQKEKYPGVVRAVSAETGTVDVQFSDPAYWGVVTAMNPECVQPVEPPPKKKTLLQLTGSLLANSLSNP